MHFTRSILALAVFAASTVQAAPGLSTSLTKRWCGFRRSCPCEVNLETGCVPQFDECAKEWFWPVECTGCECPELCVDARCDPPAV
ncbi:hypothetical protein DFH09DRAFT_1187402 [Mycena vulgaris]|nr:hypothetical protein DFH09DRAFT_1187402 [Mycena vulgaris]